MKPLSPFQNAIHLVGGVLLVIGAILPVTQMFAAYAPYVFTLGALSFGGTQILRRYEGRSLTLRRLRRQEILGAFLLMISGVLMLLQSGHLVPLKGGEWKLCLAIAAVFEVYTAFRIPIEWEKEQQKGGE